jgi:hypothetical protein
MNMDDPFGELLNGKEQEDPAAKKPAAKRKKEVGHCEYCGSSSHLTKRSKNCKARLDARKKFRRLDGSALDVAAPGIPATVDTCSSPVVATRLSDAARDTDWFDSLPFDHQLDSDDDDNFSQQFFDAVLGEEQSDDDDDSVLLVRAVL